MCRGWGGKVVVMLQIIFEDYNVLFLKNLLANRFWKIASALEFALPRYRRSNSWTGSLWIWKKNRWSEKCFSRFKSIPLSVLWHSTPPLHSLHLSSIPVQSFISQFYSQRKNWQKLLSAFLHLSTMTITGLVVPASPHAIAPGIDVSTLYKVASVLIEGC